MKAHPVTTFNETPSASDQGAEEQREIEEERQDRERRAERRRVRVQREQEAQERLRQCVIESGTDEELLGMYQEASRTEDYDATKPLGKEILRRMKRDRA
jgi:hypothetical protein